MTYPPGGPGQQPWPAQPPAQQAWQVPGQPSPQQAWPVPGQQSWPDQQQSWPSPAPGEQSWQVPGPMPGQQPWQNQPGGVETAGSAIASLITGLAAMFFLCAGTALSVVGLGIVLAGLAGSVFAVGLGIAAVVTGTIARRKIRTGAATGNGMAITGLVLGYLAIAIVLILVAVGIGLIVAYG
jgi:hypothetical protein